jgi:hypothetical protein
LKCEEGPRGGSAHERSGRVMARPGGCGRKDAKRLEEEMWTVTALLLAGLTGADEIRRESVGSWFRYVCT